MGLDMYLEGEKYYWTDWENPENNLMEDGFKVSRKILELGYWRKHPNLHGYIVKKYAHGVDECQDIYLTEENLLDIIEAVKNDKLPFTDGFFFGESQGPDDQNSVKQLTKAIEWLRIKEDKISKAVIYRASW
jgi:hypothetical protein